MLLLLLLYVCACFCLFISSPLAMAPPPSLSLPLSFVSFSSTNSIMDYQIIFFWRYEQALILWLPIQFHTYNIFVDWSLVSRHCPTNKTYIRRLLTTFPPLPALFMLFWLWILLLSLLLLKRNTLQFSCDKNYAATFPSDGSKCVRVFLCLFIVFFTGCCCCSSFCTLLFYLLSVALFILINMSFF